MTDTDEHPRQQVSRRFNSREIALGIGLVSNFGALVWQVSAANERFGTMRVEMNELKQSNAQLVGAVSRNQLFEYRLTQIELKVQALEARRR